MKYFLLFRLIYLIQSKSAHIRKGLYFPLHSLDMLQLFLFIFHTFIILVFQDIICNISDVFTMLLSITYHNVYLHEDD